MGCRRAGKQAGGGLEKTPWLGSEVTSALAAATESVVSVQVVEDRLRQRSSCRVIRFITVPKQEVLGEDEDLGRV